jgi:hypothetical protein
MRKTYNNKKIITDPDGMLIAISLGYDFCSEHEWGINGIRANLGIDISKLGIKGRKITKNDCVVYKEDKDIALLIVQSSWKNDGINNASFKDSLPYDLHIPDKYTIGEINCAWDENSFGIVGPIKYLRVLKEAFDKKDIAIAFISDKIPVFSGTSLCVCIASKLPKEALDEMYNKDKSKSDLIKYEKKIGLSQLKEKARKSSKYWVALSPKWINYEDSVKREEKKKETGTKYDIMYWVNYGDHETYGWFSVEKIKQWLSTPELKLITLGGQK